MSNVFSLPKSGTAVRLDAIRNSPTAYMQKIGRATRKPKPVLVFDLGRTPPARIRFDESAALRPVAWGKRDDALGATVCAHLRDTMPASGKGLGTPWAWNPRVYVPRWVGYLGVAILVIGALAGMTR